MSRRFALVAVLAAMVALPTASVAHDLDHPAPSFTDPAAPPTGNFNSGGPGAEWELLDTLVTGNPHSDLDFFTQGGEMYASVGLLGSSANGGGQSIAQLTNDGEVDPKLIAQHPSASCVAVATGVTGLQHDVEATPKGNVIFNADVLAANRQDAQLLLDASDAPGRCHDSGDLGLAGAGRGGLEIIDVTDPANPVEIALTSHVGQSHTVNVDPRRPHIAYSVTSDGVSVDEDGKRGNETTEQNVLDGFEVVNLRSCLEAPLGTIPPGTDPMVKRTLCKPEVYRFRYPSAAIGRGHTVNEAGQGVYGCHELEVYPDDRLTCGAGNAGIVFDMSGAFDDNGTPTDFTDDKLKGTPLPCRERPSNSAAFGTDATITDCVTGTASGQNVDLRIPNWLATGAPSLTGVKHLGTAFHQGRAATQDGLVAPFTSAQDIDFDHELELTASGRFVLATDERGGGIAPPGATCSPAGDNAQGNGGLHAYSVDRLKQSVPSSAAAAFESYARTPDGKKAIYRAPIRTSPRRRCAPPTCSSRSLARTGSSWAGTPRAPRSSTTPRRPTARSTSSRPATSSRPTRTSGSPTSSRSSATRTAASPTTARRATSTSGGTGAQRDRGLQGHPARRRPPARQPDRRWGGLRAHPLPGRRVKVGPRNIGRLKLGQSRSRTARRARPLGNISKRTRVYRYCVKGKDKKARGLAVFDKGKRLRLAATNGKAHTLRGIRRGSTVAALRKRFGKRLAPAGAGLRVLRTPKRNKSRAVFILRGGKVRYVAIVDRKLASKPGSLRAYLRLAKLRR